MPISSNINANSFSSLTLTHNFFNVAVFDPDDLGSRHINIPMRKGNIAVILKTDAASIFCTAIPPKNAPAKVPHALAIQLLL